MSKIILIGIPHSGKSTLGRMLAAALKIPFYDTDTLAMDKVNAERPTDLFRLALSGLFRKAQHEVMVDLYKINGPAVISTGAEAALAPECAELIKKLGIVIYLQRKPEIVIADLKRTAKYGFVRIEKDGTEISMHEEGIGLYAKELSKYEALADYSIENNGSEEEGLEKLLGLVNWLGKLID